MNVETLFTTPIFHQFIDIDLDNLTDYCLRLYGQSEGRKKSNKLGWQSNDIQDDEEIQFLINKLNIELEHIKQHSNISDDRSIRVSNMWVNVNKKYSYNAPHIHSGSFFSGVFYVRVPENSGRINFENPSSLQKIFIQSYKNHLKNYNQFSAYSWTYDPRPNMMLVFPSWIEHNVEQNLSDHDRISIAFNTNIFVDK